MAKSSKNNRGVGTGRLSRDQWLQRSIQVLDAEGVAGLTIENLTARLGVTQGSFYWHFKSHPQFLRELMEKWAEEDTYSVGKALAELELPPQEMLREALRHILLHSRANMDMNFRHLANTYPFLREQLQAVDDYRYKTIEGLFRNLGYSGRQLRMRTYAFIVLNGLEHGLSEPMSRQEKLKLLDERLQLFL